MKVLKEDFSYENLLKHVKHVIEYKDDVRYEDEALNLIKSIKNFGKKYNYIANMLVITPAGLSYGNDNVVGYLKNNHTAVKYDKINQDFVVYDLNKTVNNIITLHKKTLKQYNSIKERDFYKELPENQY